MQQSTIDYTNASERELVVGCQRGERQAHDAFYRRYRSYVTCVVIKVLGPEASVEDVVHDTFLEVFRTIDGFAFRARITTWLYRVTVNMALASRRRRRALPAAVVDQETSVSSCPHQTLQSKEALRSVGQRLDEMPLSKRRAFLMRELEQLSYAAIARAMRVPVATVRTRVFYARQALQTIER